MKMSDCLNYDICTLFLFCFIQVAAILTLGEWIVSRFLPLQISSLTRCYPATMMLHLDKDVEVNFQFPC